MSAVESPPGGEASIWHDVECGAYAADLPVWRELAQRCDGPILELGAGTGRVAIDLARRGRSVVAVERDPELASTLAARVADAGLAVSVEVADLRELDLERRFDLAIAPMQLFQVIGDGGARCSALAAIARHLRGGGLAAAAIIEAAPAGDADADAVPDVGELGAWVYSSTPTELRVEPGAFEAIRSRQRVSPAGELTETRHVDRLVRIGADALDVEAATAGLEPVERLVIPADDAFIGASVCVWRNR